MTAAAALRDAPHASFREAGYWLDKSVDQLLTEAAARAPDKVAIVADRADRDGPARWHRPHRRAGCSPGWRWSECWCA